MRLTFSKENRSIRSFPTIDIASDFVVITGINGAGKSHLLEAILKGAVQIQGISPNAPHIRMFHHSNMVPNNAVPADPAKLWSERGVLWSEMSSFVDVQRNNIRTQLMQHGVPSEQLEYIDGVLNWSQEDLAKHINNPAQAPQVYQKLTNLLSQSDNQVWQQWQANGNRGSLAEAMRASTGHAISITQENFEKHIPLDWSPIDVFQQNFASLFATYYRLREENKINKFYATQEQENREWIEDNVFIDNFGPPPWETINDILSVARLPIRVNKPSGPYDQPFVLRLRHTELECDIQYANLSSGEKIIMSLANCLYYAQSGNPSLTFPKVLLLDEPDAPLHPTMAKSFMDVIQDVLVRDRGVKVIMTTHSPSTVAFAPEGAVFTLNRSPRQLCLSTQEKAISVLTNGFATVMPSTKFVIVEAAFDQHTYQTLYDSISDSLNGQHPPLLFIRASDSTDRTGGGSSQVSNWAEKLSDSGLSFFRGVLDRDVGNTPTDVVLVLNRYSIENYLLDPIAIYACLMERNLHDGVFDSVEITNCNIHLLAKLSGGVLQEIACAVFKEIESYRPELATSEEFEVKYRNGIKITAPTWLRDTRGHDLSTYVRHCFRDGQAFVFSKNLEELVLMLSAKTPEFVSSDLEQLFVSLAD